MSKGILLTGSPACGKTTVIRRVLVGLPIQAGGFYTSEIREAGQRVGFEIVSLDGRRGVLAHVNIRSPKRVGKYGVDLDTLNSLAVGAIRSALGSRKLVVIDEIGPMEIASSQFRQAVTDVLESQVRLLGTIVRRSTPFTDAVKRNSKVTLIEVTRENRQTLPARILSLLEVAPESK